ncbi:GFA family protein [Vibrio kasasachensis]|uniref:GFA family protein n=1 Tax=Vibrio kasasachensis TaxID=2910248 RepID=UPI003D150966
MGNDITGTCMCGACQFEVKDDFKRFYFCHCKQCQKLTSSSHAANLFALPENLKWVKGEDQTILYHHPTRLFTRRFCKYCGSGLPVLTKNGKFMLVPAGALESEPSRTVDARIFIEEQAQWHKLGLEQACCNGFPS